MKNTDLDALMTTISEGKAEKKHIKKEIKEETEKLHNRLTIQKNKIKAAKNAIRSIISDKEEHIIKRLWAWTYYGEKEIADWIIEQGMMRDTLFDDMNRHQTYYLEDCLLDHIHYEVNHPDFVLDEVWDPNNIIYFNELDEADQVDLAELIEDALEQNVSEFTCDW